MNIKDHAARQLQEAKRKTSTKRGRPAKAKAKAKAKAEIRPQHPKPVKPVLRVVGGRDLEKPRKGRKAGKGGAKPFRIKLPRELVALLRGRRPSLHNWAPPEGQSAFTPYKPSPGAIPQGHQIAMDEVVAGLSWSALATTSINWYEGQHFLGYPLLAEMAQRPEYRRISERLATEMTRKWIMLKSTDTADEKDKRVVELADYLKDLKIREAFQEVALQDGLMGRSHLYIDTGDTDDPKELQSSIGSGRDAITAGKAKRGWLKRVQAVEAVWCYPSTYNATNPLKPSWFKPDQWFVMGQSVHSTRLLTFIGRDVPDLLKPAYAFGGISLTQMAKPYVDNWLRTRQAVSDLVSNFSKNGLKTNLMNTLAPSAVGGTSMGGTFEASSSGLQDLLTRLDMFTRTSDNQGIMAIDKQTEDFFQFNTPLGTLDQLQAQALEQLCMIGGTPVVILLGLTPHGLNASSDGEIRAFEDWIEAYQKHLFGENLRRVIDFAMISLWGEVDPTIVFEFEPLHTMTPKEKEDIEKAKSDRDTAYVDRGILDPLEVRTKLAADPDSGYNGIDVEDVPEPPGGGGEGGGQEGGGQEQDPFAGMQDAAQNDNDENDYSDLDSPEVGDEADRPFAHDAAWEEGKHPRKKGGEFAPKGGGESGAGKSAGPKIEKAPDGLIGSYGGVTDTQYHIWAEASIDINEALNGTLKAGQTDSYGQPIDEADLQEYREIADKLQAAASSNAVKAGALYRGESFESLDELKAKYKHNAVVETAGLTSTAIDEDIAKTYATTDESGPVQAVIEYGSKYATMPGIQTAPMGVLSGEVVMPKGVKYRVGSISKREDGLYRINLYSTERHDLPAVPVWRPGDHAQDEKWEENKHPRDESGEFTSGGGSSGAGGKPAASKPAAKVPLDPTKLKKVGGQKGSNPGGVYKDQKGDLFYIKKGKSADHVRNELIAGQLYQLAGAPTLDYEPVKGGGHIATKLAKLDKNNVKQLSPEEREQAQRDFATHAWLANWDAVGLGGDNIGTIKGVPTSLDLGGAMAYRAQGAPKGSKFGDKVGELDTMRDRTMNPDAGALYGKMTDQQLRASAKRVTSIPDAKIAATVRAGGGSEELIDKLIARKRDIAKRFNIAAGEMARDEAQWEESKHPRGKGGKFAHSAGGGGGSQPGYMAKYYATSGPGPQENHHLTVQWVLANPVKKGSHYRGLLNHLIAEAGKHGNEQAIPKLKAKLGEAYFKAADELKAAMAKEKDQVAYAKMQTQVNNAYKKAAKLGFKSETEAKQSGESAFSQPEAQPVKKQSIVEKMTQPKPEPAAQYPQATPAELQKAAKTTPVPISSSNPDAVELIKAFNEKYAGKPITDPAALNQKVAEHKAMMEKVHAINEKEKAKAEAELKAKQEAEAKAKAEADAKAHEEMATIASELGISNHDAEAIQGFVELAGAGSVAAAVKKFKSLENEAASKGLPISSFEYAMIASYKGSGYAAVNAALRKGSWSLKQHIYVNTLNKALKKMPPYPGPTIRNTELPTSVQQLYKVGNVIEERAFTSTSKKSIFSGNTQYVVQGKSGRDISKLASHHSEEEVLYPARTFFRVTKVEGNPGGQMKIHMEEVDAW